MPEATTVQCGDAINWTADTARTKGDVIQLPDGRAGVILQDVSAGQPVGVQVRGFFTLTKTASMVILRGGRVFWDHSANAASYKKVNDRDFYVGRAQEDAVYAATTNGVKVALNINPPADIDALGGEGGVLSVATGTQALGGFLTPQVFGKSRALRLTATSEVQCVDILSVDRFDKGANAIAEFVFRLGTNGSTSDTDLNFGIANGTSTSDADAITEHVLFHIDGGSLVINAQSKDGTTTVAAATTGVSATAGSAVSDRVELWIDTRDPADVQLYVNGANVLPSSVFRIDGATGPFGLLAHLEKATGTATAGPTYVDRMEARFMEA